MGYLFMKAGRAGLLKKQVILVAGVEAFLVNEINRLLPRVGGNLSITVRMQPTPPNSPRF
jgi:hypothetical protein